MGKDVKPSCSLSQCCCCLKLVWACFNICGLGRVCFHHFMWLFSLFISFSRFILCQQVTVNLWGGAVSAGLWHPWRGFLINGRDHFPPHPLCWVCASGAPGMVFRLLHYTLASSLPEGGWGWGGSSWSVPQMGRQTRLVSFLRPILGPPAGRRSLPTSLSRADESFEDITTRWCFFQQWPLSPTYLHHQPRKDRNILGKQ